MVYKTKDSNSLIVNCSCRCGDGIEFTISNFDNIAEVWLTQTTYSWNSESATFWDRLKTKLKRLWLVIRNKEYHYTEISLSKTDFDTFVEYINKMHENINKLNDENNAKEYLGLTKDTDEV